MGTPAFIIPGIKMLKPSSKVDFNPKKQSVPEVLKRFILNVSTPIAHHYIRLTCFLPSYLFYL